MSRMGFTSRQNLKARIPWIKISRENLNLLSDAVNSVITYD